LYEPSSLLCFFLIPILIRDLHQLLTSDFLSYLFAFARKAAILGCTLSIVAGGVMAVAAGGPFHTWAWVMTVARGRVFFLFLRLSM
jgi:hypothetical protein